MEPPQQNLADLNDARAKEVKLVVELQECLEKLVKVVGQRLDDMDEAEIEDLPIRVVPQMLKAFSEGLTILQNSHDRITGYGMLVKELESILESQQAQRSTD